MAAGRAGPMLDRVDGRIDTDWLIETAALGPKLPPFVGG